jgi:hypothetical protein
MSTPLHRVSEGRLTKFDPELQPRKQEERLVYAFPRVAGRIERDVAPLESDIEREIRPVEQLYAVLADFCAGEALQACRHCIRT